MGAIEIPHRPSSGPVKNPVPEEGLSSPRGARGFALPSLCIAIGVLMGVCFAGLNRPLEAQEGGGVYRLRLAPVFTKSLGDSPPQYDFGIGMDLVVGDFLGVWASGYPDETSIDCLVSSIPGCNKGDFIGSVGINLHYLGNGWRPYAGVGVGTRHYTSGDWEKGLSTFRAGLDLTGKSRFGLRGEVVRHSDSGWLIALGVSVGIFRRTPA